MKAKKNQLKSFYFSSTLKLENNHNGTGITLRGICRGPGLCPTKKYISRSRQGELMTKVRKQRFAVPMTSVPVSDCTA